MTAQYEVWTWQPKVGVAHYFKGSKDEAIVARRKVVGELHKAGWEEWGRSNTRSATRFARGGIVSRRRYLVLYCKESP